MVAQNNLFHVSVRAPTLRGPVVPLPVVKEDPLGIPVAIYK